MFNVDQVPSTEGLNSSEGTAGVMGNPVVVKIGRGAFPSTLLEWASSNSILFVCFLLFSSMFCISKSSNLILEKRTVILTKKVGIFIILG